MAAASAGYSFALGAASVALPLQALAVGYTAVEVGVLTAVSAISQLVTRMFLGSVMRRVPDWIIIAAACALLSVSCLVVVATSAVVPFVAAQLLQGISRACFWTGSQTHVVRGDGSSIKALASINLVGNLGLLSGPVVAGLLIADDARLALGVAAGGALAALIPASRLHRLPPFRKLVDRQPGHIWQRAGVWEGCHAGITAGAWRALLGSYVPLALVQAGQAAVTVGALVAIANAAAILGAWLVRHLADETRVRRALLLCTPVTGIALAGVGVLAPSAALAAIALSASGVAAGALQTLGPAIAADAVHREERGDAIAATGAFRAGSLFVTPLATAGMVAVVPIGTALVVAGILMAVPVGRRARVPPLA
ncbi:MAG: MFS transporter [Nocardioides sp.]|nr:MFS transporter [Nocardioides sp.]